MIIKRGKVINRGLTPKDGCGENGTSIAGSVKSLVKSLNHNYITHKCCAWSCCNYNTTLADLTSPPTSAPNISLSGLVWQGSRGGSCTHNTQMIILMIVILNIFSN